MVLLAPWTLLCMAPILYLWGAKDYASLDLLFGMNMMMCC